MKALILVDIQNDFCKGGALEVKDGDDIVELVNDLMLNGNYDTIIATLDWHPANHKSFASNNNLPVFSMSQLGNLPQVMWPEHCVQNSKGAQLHPKLNSNLINHVIQKGTNSEVDSYSGFFDNDKKSQTGLDKLLKTLGVDEVDVVGLALDYCVKATAIDSKNLGYNTTVLVDMTKAVNMNIDDDKKAVQELKDSGVLVK